MQVFSQRPFCCLFEYKQQWSKGVWGQKLDNEKSTCIGNQHLHSLTKEKRPLLLNFFISWRLKYWFASKPLGFRDTQRYWVGNFTVPTIQITNEVNKISKSSPKYFISTITESIKIDNVGIPGLYWVLL